MIVVDNDQIGSHGKSEKIMTADLGRRLVIEWTAQLPQTRRGSVTR
jgi:hypothetical protein